DIRLPAAVHGADESDPATEARAPASRDQQPPAGPLRTRDRPAIAFHTVQPPEKQIVLVLHGPEHEVRRVQTVVDERVAAVSLRMVAGNKDVMGGDGGSRPEVSLQRLDARMR